MHEDLCFLFPHDPYIIILICLVPCLPYQLSVKGLEGIHLIHWYARLGVLVGAWTFLGLPGS